jgi:ATP-dependent protease ClpP protease subunit
MKVLGLVLGLLLAGSVWAAPPMEELVEKIEKLESICTETGMDTGCLNCHRSPGFELREQTTEEKYSVDGDGYPTDFYISERDGKDVGFYFLDGIYSVYVDDLFQWLDKKPAIKHLIIEVYSPGGSMFEAKRIIGMMDEYKAKGNVIETRVRGGAASAGFLVFLNGTIGHRYIHAQAEIMWHELRTVEGWFLKLSTPADKEDEARVMRHWQDTQDQWIADRSNLSKEEVTKLIRHKELWCNGKEAVEKYGFADKLIE